MRKKGTIKRKGEIARGPGRKRSGKKGESRARRIRDLDCNNFGIIR